MASYWFFVFLFQCYSTLVCIALLVIAHNFIRFTEIGNLFFSCWAMNPEERRIVKAKKQVICSNITSLTQIIVILESKFVIDEIDVQNINVSVHACSHCFNFYEIFFIV